MSDQLEQAITAIKSGDKTAGRRLLTNLLASDPGNEKAWLWLTQTTDSIAERIVYLEKILAINPDNKAAGRGLAKLRGELALGQKQLLSGLQIEQALEETELSRLEMEPTLAETKLAKLDVERPPAEIYRLRLEIEPAPGEIHLSPLLTPARPRPNQLRLAILIFLAFGLPGCIILGLAGFLLRYALNY